MLDSGVNMKLNKLQVKANTVVPGYSMCIVLISSQTILICVHAGRVGTHPSWTLLQI